MNSNNALDEIYRYLAKTSEELEAISLAENANDLRDSWERFLQRFTQTTGKMIKLSYDFKEARPWSHRLKNASQTEDEGMVYLREARNVVEHGLIPFANFNNSCVSVANDFISVENGSVLMQECFINGRYIDFVSVDVRHGKIASLDGDRVAVEEVLFGVTLMDLKTPDKPIKVVKIPKSIFGQSVLFQNPCDLAAKADEGLKIKYDELTILLGNQADV